MPLDVTQVLTAKAHFPKVLDRKLAEAAHSSTPSPYSRTLPADHLHSHLFRHAGKDFARDGVYGAKPRTVRDWLQSIAHPDDAAKLAPEA